MVSILKHVIFHSRCRVGPFLIWKNMCTSALYITGDKASETCAVVSPHFDADKRFVNISNLQKNLKERGMTTNVNDLKNLWDLLKEVQANKTRLEQRRVEIANKMKSLKTKGNIEDVGLVKRDADKYRIEGKLVRDDLKTLMKGLWDLEGRTMLKLLALPNDLHPDTPDSVAKVVFEYKSKPDVILSTGHLEKGVSANILLFNNEINYYLMGDAALFELGVLDYFGRVFKNANFTQFSNTDFGRSVVIEGVGLDYKDPLATIILQNDDDVVNNDDRLHLIGGASLVSFSAFLTKQIVNTNSLPLKSYTLGRKYNPARPNPKEGLFKVWQESVLEVFLATPYHEEMMQEFNNTLRILIEAYKELGFHFRVVYLPAKALHVYESLRASFQMYSAYSQSYVEVGHVALCDDYISERLLMTYDEGKSASVRRFVHIVTGTAVSVPKLLACVLEQKDSDGLEIPEPIKCTMFACV